MNKYIKFIAVVVTGIFLHLGFSGFKLNNSKKEINIFAINNYNPGIATEPQKNYNNGTYTYKYTVNHIDGNLKSDLNANIYIPNKDWWKRIDCDLLKAVQYLNQRKVFLKIDNLKIKIDDSLPQTTGTTASYDPNSDMIIINAYYLNKNKYKSLVSILCHELTHKYIEDELGHSVPIWTHEGFATQYDQTEYGKYCTNLANYDINKNFKYLCEYPTSNEEKKRFYEFNYRFIKKWLLMPENSINQLIQYAKNLVRNKNYETANKICYDYIMKTGGTKILESFKSKVA